MGEQLAQSGTPRGAADRDPPASFVFLSKS
jgi:hypothetical protein